MLKARWEHPLADLKIEWYRNEDGGRGMYLPKGSQYRPMVSFSERPSRHELYGAVIRISDAALGEAVLLGFLDPRSALPNLLGGRRHFWLVEGKRVVARVEIRRWLPRLPQS